MSESSSIALVMLVKDEAEHVARGIRSVRPLLAAWAVIDTGSTDGTQEIVRAEFDGIPGEIVERPFTGFAEARTELLRLGRETGAEYVLQLDADLEVELLGELPALSADEYMLGIEDRGLRYSLPLLTRASKPYRYEGVAHSYLVCDEPVRAEPLPQLRIFDRAAGGRREGKIARDRDLLAAEVARNPSDRRSWFYLAQSHRDLGQVQEAIDCYRRRAELGGWEEEVYYSLYQAGALLCEHVDAREGMQLLLEAYRLRPTRAEALRALSHVARNVAEKIAFPPDVLFVSPGAYREAA